MTDAGSAAATDKSGFAMDMVRNTHIHVHIKTACVCVVIDMRCFYIFALKLLDLLIRAIGMYLISR